MILPKGQSAIPRLEFVNTVHREQFRFLKAFDQGLARFSMLVWHRRARKTSLLLNLLIRQSTSHFNHVYTYVAPTYKQGKKIIWRDPNMLFKWLPDKDVEPWEKNESELFIRFPRLNTYLHIVGADDPDSLRGQNSNGVGFDEWSMMKQNVWTEIFRPIIAEDPKRWSSFIFTPKGQNFSYTMWQWALENPEWYTSLLDAETSGLIPKAELELARQEMPRSLYDQEFMCKFVTEEELTLITSAMLDKLRDVEKAISDNKCIIACDPALGGDECPAYVIKNTEIIDQRYMNHRDTVKIGAELDMLGHDYDCNDFIVDSIGIGEGVCGELTRRNRNVQKFVSSEKAWIRPERYKNRKAEAWWYVRELVKNYDVLYPNDVELRRQICGVKFKLSDGSGKLQIEPKLKTKQTLGCSPDRADTWVMGIYGLQYVEPKVKKIDAYKEDREPGIETNILEMSI